MSTDVSIASAAHDLETQLGSDRVLQSGTSYDDARRLWNRVVDSHPALIAHAATARDVQAAIRVARDHGLPLSVRGGGHDWAGRAVREGGLLVDLSGMRQVAADPDTRIATLAGGATAADVIAAAEPYELSAVTGTVGSVGMVGLTLAGGYGPLMGRFGLAVDNLMSAEIVLADGTIVTTDADHEPELFWALRGGGGNFGVVTSMRIRLHPVHRVWAGLIVFPLSEATDVWRRLREMLATAPDELTVQSGILAGPDGAATMYIAPAWSGDLTRGESVVGELQQLGTALVAQVAPMTYADMLGLFDAALVPGTHYAIRTRTVAGFSTTAVSALVAAGVALTSPRSGVPIHHFHGAAARVPLESTAFGIRRDHFVVEIVAGWAPEDVDGARHRIWADDLHSALAADALPGGYANLLAPDDREQIAHAYGANARRLLAAKRRFDPDGVFTATPLPPAPN